jgi:DNA polymerase-3 subunit epsilon
MYAIVDIETTGGYANRNKIIDIAIIIHDGEKVVETYQSLVNPERLIPQQITQLTGITNEMVEDAPKFFEIAKEVMELTEGKVFVAHNVGFDYSFIKHEFRELGGTFQRKRLCTVRLSRKIFSGLPSYSLGNLCGRLGIEIKDRHRALGDAEATVKLFDLLLHYDSEDVIDDALHAHSREGILPPNLPKETFDKLPEETGVYFFHDDKGNVIYVGKARNIKSRVISHFMNNKEGGINARRKSRIFDITFEITGSELIALLHESYEIKRLNPLYNRAQKRVYLNTGIYEYYDHNGYLRLGIGKVKELDNVLIAFQGVVHARKFLERKMREHELCAKLTGLQKSAHACFDHQVGICHGACDKKERPEIYNKRVRKAIDSFAKEEKSYAILGRGRDFQEKSVVLVENGVFLGYGFFTGEVVMQDPVEFKDYIQYRSDNQDVQRIINQYLRKNKRDVVIPYSITV